MFTPKRETQLRRTFNLLNRYFMVPMFRLGMGPLMGTPFGGYIMVVKVIGRKTGKIRYAPVNYAIDSRSVYCLAGFGAVSDWYRNLLTHPNIEAIMPGGTIAGVAEQVTDPVERLRMLRCILINAGFAGFFYGYNPRTVADEQLLDTTRDVPLIRIRVYGIGSGASDPGGWVWVGSVIGTLLFISWLFGRKRR